MQGLRIVEKALGTYGISSEDEPGLPAADRRPTAPRNTRLAGVH
jgi:hypothetical protein